MANKSKVSFPHSKIKEGMVQVLQDEGYVTRFEVLDTQPARTIQVHLKWNEDGEKLIHEIRRVSKPGCRVYRQTKELKPIIRTCIQVVSTSKGILSDQACRVWAAKCCSWYAR